MSKNRSEFEQRMKYYESFGTGDIIMPLLPVICRLDGKCFHNFCSNMDRPFDAKLNHCFDLTTMKLMQYTGATVGYTQSDEITLIFYNEKYESQMFFGGRIFKIISVLAAFCSVRFTGIFKELFVSDKYALFDCRLWQVPNLIEATNVLVWRELDCTRNSITMVAQTVYSDKQLHQKNSKQKQEILFAKGINWNDYPDRFKRGQYFIKKKVFEPLSQEIMDKIPVDKRPTGPVERTYINGVKLPKITTIDNRVGVFFMGEEPRVSASE